MSFVLNHTHDPNSPDSYTSRIQYLEDLLPGRFVDSAEMRLCNVMAVTNERMAPDDADPLPFAWLTPVLGSGAMTGPKELEAVREQVTQAVSWLGSRTDADGYPTDGRLEQSESVAHFASSLVRDRLGDDLDEDDLIASQLDVDPHDEYGAQCALSLLAASLLTRAYYQIQSVRHVAMPRAGRGHAVLDRRVNPITAAELTTDYLEPAERALEDALEASGDDRRAKGVFTYALDELTGARREISQNSVRLLTEYCWYLINNSLYPAWSDLLWSLFISGKDWPPSDHDRGPRPISINLESAPEEVQRLYERRSERLRARAAGRTGQGAAPLLYQRVTDVLRAQTVVRARRKEASMPPVPSAFVTTFDVELERALAEHGEPFVVVFPATASIKWPDAPSLFLWLGYRVDPAGGGDPYRAIVEPRSVFVLSHDLAYHGKRMLSDLPHIVHLTGSPLVSIPNDVGSQVRDGLEANTHGLRRFLGHFAPPDEHQQDAIVVSRVTHAVILDEYAALNQTVNALNRRAAPETRDRLWPGLPLSVTGSIAPHDFTRFWLLLGVQGGDVPVRHAVVTHLVNPDAFGRNRATAYPIRNGAAVNRRLSGEAEDLMLWSGLDVIRTRLEDVNDDLVHYVDHLTGGDIEPLPRPAGSRCELGGRP